MLHSVSEINRFAGVFFKDVADVYDAITRIKNLDRNPNGFSLDDAPILGLLVRVWKLLKEMLKYYETDNAEIISILERPLIEAAVTATYLLQCDANVLLDYRKCSYKDRLRILADITSGSSFSQTKAGQRLGVRPSNRRDGHVTACCAPTISLAPPGDGRVGVRASGERLDLAFTGRGDRA